MMLYHKKYSDRRDVVWCNLFFDEDPSFARNTVDVYTDKDSPHKYASKLNLSKVSFSEYLIHLDMKNIKWIKIRFTYSYYHTGDNMPRIQTLKYENDLDLTEIERKLKLKIPLQ